MVSLLLTCARPWAPLIAGVLEGEHPLESAVDAGRGPSMGRPLLHSFMRNELLDLTTTLSATACHQRNYVETYSRSMNEH